jgi:hypothetical protein
VKKFKVLVRLITEEDFQNYLTTWNSLEQLGTAKIKLYFYLQKKVCQSIKDSFCTAFLKAVLFFAQLFLHIMLSRRYVDCNGKKETNFLWFPLGFRLVSTLVSTFKPHKCVV